MLWRYRLFDIAPLARDAVIEHLADGVVVGGLSVRCAGDLVAGLMDAADEALYAAKHEGRDRVCITRGA